MTPDQARQHARQLQEQLLNTEAAHLAAGWRFVTVDGLAIESETDLDRYEQALSAFDEAAAGHQSRHMSSSSRVTFGIRGDDAEQQIAVLRARLEKLNPPGPWGPRRWEIRVGAR
jgi:hypothetical protein